MNIMTPSSGVTSAMRGILQVRAEIKAQENAEAASSSSAQPKPVVATPYHQGKFVDLRA